MSTSDDGVTVLVSGASARGAALALARKEARESLAAVIAGGSIFVALPLFATVLYAITDGRHEVVAGVSSVMLCVFGPLFAAIIGAQCVCRDLGRSAGNFLEGLPIGRIEILRAKALVSFGLVLGLVCIIGLIEPTLAYIDARAAFPISYLGAWQDWWLTALFLCTLAFWAAFLTAAITRQLMSSVLISGTLGMILIAIPMISSVAEVAGEHIERAWGWFNGWWTVGAILTRLEPQLNPWTLQGAFGYAIVDAGLEWVFNLLVVLGQFAVWLAIALAVRRILDWRKRPARGARVLRFGLDLVVLGALVITQNRSQLRWIFVPAGCAIAGWILWRIARLTAGVELRMQFGRKAAAWTVGAATLGILLVALREVGADARPIRTIHLPIDAVNNGIWRHGLGLGVAVSGSRVVLWTDPARPFWGTSTALLDIADPRGQLIPIKLISSQVAVTPGTYDRDTFIVLGDDGRGFRIAAHRIANPQNERAGGEISLRRIDWKTNTASPPISAELPYGLSPTAEWWVFAATLVGDRICLLIDERTASTLKGLGRRYRDRALLATYDISDVSAPRLVDDIALGENFVAVDPETGQYWGWRFERTTDDRTLVVDALAQQTTIDLKKLIERRPDWSLSRARFYGGSNEVNLADNVAAISHRSGFGVNTFKRATAVNGRSFFELETDAFVRASPLSFIWRSNSPQLLPVIGGVWEVHRNNAIFYDVHDPAHPRKTAHANTPTILSAQVTPEYLVLLHPDSISVYRHPPVRR